MQKFLACLVVFSLAGAGGCKKSTDAGASGDGGGGKQLVVAVMPKSKGNDYFKACKVGADKAAKELNVKLIWDGPTTPDPPKQNDMVDVWITRGVDVIAVACDNGAGSDRRKRNATSWADGGDPDFMGRVCQMFAEKAFSEFGILLTGGDA